MMRWFLFAVLMFLTACGTSESLAPVTHYGGASGASASGVHVVQEGDNLWSISNRYQIAMRDIVFANKLSDPFILVPGERINLPPPRKHTVRGGESLYKVSRLYGVGSSEVARLNDLRAPYVIHPGQVLRLPSGQSGASSAPLQLSKNNVAAPSKKPVPKSLKAPARSSDSGVFLRPVDGQILSDFGPKNGGLHNDGMNIYAAKGTPVKAAENGVVVYSGNALKGSGNLVLVRHDGGYVTAYAHLDQANVAKGAILKRGQTLGTVGSTGNVSRPQLHFEIRKGTKAINPANYIAG